MRTRSVADALLLPGGQQAIRKRSRSNKEQVHQRAREKTQVIHDVEALARVASIKLRLCGELKSADTEAIVGCVHLPPEKRGYIYDFWDEDSHIQLVVNHKGRLTLINRAKGAPGDRRRCRLKKLDMRQLLLLRSRLLQV